MDLAISQKATADCTAVIMIHVYGHKPEDRKYYIDKQFINSRLTHLATLQAITTMYRGIEGQNNQTPKTLVEQVQYQAAVVEQLKDREVQAKGIPVHIDKRARLNLASALFEQGRVYFPEDRAVAPIIQQIVGFGVEKHDDLADAISMGLNYIQTNVRWEVVNSFGFSIGDYSHFKEYWGITYLDEVKGRD